MQLVLVISPDLKPYLSKNSRITRMDEACALAESINLKVSYSEQVNLSEVRSSTLFGKGTLERFANLILDLCIEVVIVNGTITPVQQRNLERFWNCKVIDRTALILEIFSSRAKTREGYLQVELAQLNYQKTRLVRGWTHLERQRGGGGFLGELDRRLISERIINIKKELKKVVKTRGLHRSARKRVPFPIIVMVGYTNAGKSTLFNKITGSNVEAKDRLFDTLDPTMRVLKLPSGSKIIICDTVGFISDLPHELIAAFRATLEELTDADIILHVRDISHPENHGQKNDVEDVLNLLKIDFKKNENLIEVHTKSDLIESDSNCHYKSFISSSKSVLVSSLTGYGIDNLLELVDNILSHHQSKFDINLSVNEGKKLAWLYEHGQVLERHDSRDKIKIKVLLSSENANRFMKSGN